MNPGRLVEKVLRMLSSHLWVCSVWDPLFLRGQTWKCHNIDALVQERCYSSALAMELRLSCINPSPWKSSSTRKRPLLQSSATFFNTLRPRQNGRHFPDDIFKCIFLNENEWISLTILLKFVSKGQINNIPSLVQIMAWRRLGDKPLSEPVMVRVPTHICVTRPQWVNVCKKKQVVGKTGHLLMIWDAMTLIWRPFQAPSIGFDNMQLNYNCIY